MAAIAGAAAAAGAMRLATPVISYSSQLPLRCGAPTSFSIARLCFTVLSHCCDVCLGCAQAASQLLCLNSTEKLQLFLLCDPKPLLHYSGWQAHKPCTRR